MSERLDTGMSRTVSRDRRLQGFGAQEITFEDSVRLKVRQIPIVSI